MADMDTLDVIVPQLEAHGEECVRCSQEMRDILENVCGKALVRLRDQHWEGAAKEVFQGWYPKWRQSFLNWCNEVEQWGVKTKEIAATYDEKDREAASQLNQLEQQQVTPDDVGNW